MNNFDEEEIARYSAPFYVCLSMQLIPPPPARAIALSLQESSRSSKGVREVIEIPDDVIEITDDDELRGCALLVLANKQDQPGAMPVAELTDRLGLQALRRPWHVQVRGVFCP